jgi:hypothetical protein
MTHIGSIFSELEHIWRVRCGKCGATQILAFTLKTEAEAILRDPLGWKYTKAQGWICPRDHTSVLDVPDWNPINLNESL